MRKFLIVSLLIGCGSNHKSYNESVSVPPPSSFSINDTSPDASTPIFNNVSSLPPVSTAEVCTPHCQLNDSCNFNSDCISDACNDKHKCIENRSCINYLGGSSCGSGEVGDPKAVHESCCRSLSVGYVDSSHPGKTIYLDKYEITAGRMRTFVDAVIQEMGKPDFKSWVQMHRPAVWNDDWNKFLPSDYEGGTIVISRLLLGDPRHQNITQAEAPPGVIVPPTTDQVVNVGFNHQFNGQVFVDVHGNNCGTFAGSYGFPTYYYPDNVSIKNGEVPRTNALSDDGKSIPPQEWLDTKSLNCSPNFMLQLFCNWVGGELMSSEIFDFITESPINRPIDISGCGIQHDSHGDLLGNNISTSLFLGGKCPDVYAVNGFTNVTFDAGDSLPVAGSFLNSHVYFYPDLGNSINDKSWTVASPGRMTKDVIHISPTEGWKDLAGNLTETVLETVNGIFTGKFSMRGRGIGFGSAHSDLNVSLMPTENILRVQRPEAKSALVGARCQYFK